MRPTISWFRHWRAAAILVTMVAMVVAGGGALAGSPAATQPQSLLKAPSRGQAQAQPSIQAQALAAPVADPRPADLVVPQGQGRLIRINRPIGSVVVGDQRIADVKLVAAQTVYVFGAAIGRTDLTVLNEDETVMASMRVVVAHDAASAAEDLKRVHPGSGLNYDVVGNRLVLHGSGASVEAAAAAQRILAAAAPDGAGANEATYAGPNQISLKVRFAEVSRSQVQNLGFDWSSLFSLGAGSIGLATGGSVGQVVGAAPSLALSPYGTLSGGLSTSRINANVVLEALETRGAVHTIAEPTLTVRSGKTAKFRAGGDIPVPVPQQQGAVTIEYHPYGISLEFTPILIGRNRIAIHVAPEVSDVSEANGVTFAGASVPSFTIRKAETDVELASGQTFAIAGLFQRNVSNSRDSVPGLGNLPVLGNLFASDQYKRGETELVILITPYLVEPIAPAAAATPTQADDGKTGRATATVLVERMGFIVE